MYVIGRRVQKRERYGLHSEIEKTCLASLKQAISAALESRDNKFPKLKELNINIETLKQLVRLEYELKIISGKTYIRLEKDLQEISKMSRGWISFIQKETR